MKFKLSMIYVVFLLYLTFGQLASFTNTVLLEFFYIDTSKCPHCFEEIIYKLTQVEKMISEVQGKYGRVIEVKRWDLSSNGSALFQQYNLTGIPSIVINAKEILSDQEITQEKLQSIINSILNYPTSEDLIGMIYLGFLSFLSPCTITLLLFILSYVINSSFNARNWIKKAVVFSLGFIITQMVLFGLFSIEFSFTNNIQTLLKYVIRLSSIGLILGGLELFGLIKFPYDSSFLEKLKAYKYNLGFLGVFYAGGLFFMVETFNTPSFSYTLSARNLFSLLSFSLGILLPFLVIGLIGIKIVGTLVAPIKFDVRKMRLISGTLLITYASWLMLKILLRHF
jgi:cytochrome c biogenesis protein CcdA